MSISVKVHGDRAVAGFSAQQRGYYSKIEQLSVKAVVVIRDIVGVTDGSYEAVYEGRGAFRDVYLVDNRFVLKLCNQDKREHNVNEALALRSNVNIYFPRFYHHGIVQIETQSVEFLVDGLLMDYGGPTLDKLCLHARRQPLTANVVNFFMSFYQECIMMVIKGRESNDCYSDLHTANISTSSDPLHYVPGSKIHPVVIDAGGCGKGMWPRPQFNMVCDQMLADFALQCSFSNFPAWRNLGNIWSEKTARLFRSRGTEEDMQVLMEEALAIVASVEIAWQQMPPDLYDIHESKAPIIMKTYQIFTSECGMSDMHSILARNVRDTKLKPSQSPSLLGRLVATNAAASTSARAAQPARLESIMDEDSTPKALRLPSRLLMTSACPKSVAASRKRPPEPSEPPTFAQIARSRAPSIRSSQASPTVTGFSVQSLPFESRITCDTSSKPSEDKQLTDEDLSQIAYKQIQKQAGSKFRGEDRFQSDRPSRMSWEDRKELEFWNHVPQMTRQQSDDVGRFLSLTFVALNNVLARCSLNHKGAPQRRTTEESEFKKYGMQKRVFQCLNWFCLCNQPWFSSDAAYNILHEEFKLLEGAGDKKYMIHGFRFEDDYERYDIIRKIVVAYMATMEF